MLSCLPNQLPKPLKPITRAKFPDFLQVQFWIARYQFHNICFGFMPPGIELQRDEVRDRNQPQRASTVYLHMTNSLRFTSLKYSRMSSALMEQTCHAPRPITTVSRHFSYDLER